MNGCYVYVCGRRLATAAQSSVFNIDRKLVRSGHRRTASVKGGCERVARKGVAARLDNVPCRRARRAERRILRLRAARDFEEAIVDALVCECDVQHAAAVGARRWNGWGAAPRKDVRLRMREGHLMGNVLRPRGAGGAPPWNERHPVVVVSSRLRNVDRRSSVVDPVVVRLCVHLVQLSPAILPRQAGWQHQREDAQRRRPLRAIARPLEVLLRD